MELNKPWNDGGNLTVTYDGSGDGSAIFSSDINTGAERSMEVSFVDMSRNVVIVRTVKQAANQISQETYTRLTYIESTGTQYINTGYVVQEDDVIEMYYIAETQTSADKCLFGVYGDNGNLFVSIYSNTAYIRFGSTSSATIASSRTKYALTLKKSSATIDTSAASPNFASMPQYPLYLFACNNKDISVIMYGICQTTGIKISKENGDVIKNFVPAKRNSDGKKGMLDLVSGNFFVNEGTGSNFLFGNEIKITDNYEVIDYIAFDEDKIYDTGVYGNEETKIDVLFKRTDTSGADYLFGVSYGDRITGYLTSSGYWRYGSAAPTFNTNNKYINHGIVTPGKTTISSISKTFTVGSAFQTSSTIPIGGYKSSPEVVPTYQGYIYYFRMWHGGECVVDFVPCRRLSDGVEGFWDCVTQRFIEPM